MKHLFPFAVLLLSATSPTMGRTWRVPSEVLTIPAAMDSSVSGDSILVAPGSHIVERLQVTNGVILTSEVGPLHTEIRPESFMYLSFGALYCEGLVDYTEISGFYIHGYRPGLIGDGSSTIWINNSRDVTIKNNIIGRSHWSVHVTATTSFSWAILENNTFTDGWVEGRFFPDLVLLELRNNIIWGSAFVASAFAADCNDFKNAVDIPAIGTGNFSADPLFCGLSSNAGQYALRSDSPCAAVQSGGCGLIGALDVMCATVPVREVTWGQMKKLYE